MSPRDRNKFQKVNSWKIIRVLRSLIAFKCDRKENKVQKPGFAKLMRLFRFITKQNTEKFFQQKVGIFAWTKQLTYGSL